MKKEQDCAELAAVVNDTTVVQTPELSHVAHTPGPWKVYETRYPHRFGGEHIERKIGTVWVHPQLEGPCGVVNLSTGIGTKEGGPVQFVQIEEANAHLIAAAPDYHAAVEQCRGRDADVISDGVYAGCVVIPRSVFEALMTAHAKAEGRE